jgi:hypothetical protein
MVISIYRDIYITIGKQEVTELKNLVVEYVRERGNGDASEVLDDYMQYLHLNGYAIRRNIRRKASSDRITPIQKAITIHLVDSALPNQ